MFPAWPLWAKLGVWYLATALLVLMLGIVPFFLLSESSFLPFQHSNAFFFEVVIRIIDSQGAIVSAERLGMTGEVRRRWTSLLESPNGIVLVTGPTGSGKSTTLYSPRSVRWTRTRGTSRRSRIRWRR